MIFGFNTDIKHEDTVYHVQSEAREASNCCRRKSSSAAAVSGNAPFPMAPVRRKASALETPVLRTRLNSNDQDKEKMLRELHREVLDAIREASWIPFSISARPGDVGGGEGVGSDMGQRHVGSFRGALIMQIRVTDGGATVSGARLTLRFTRPKANLFMRRFHRRTGVAEMHVRVDERISLTLGSGASWLRGTNGHPKISAARSF